MASATKTLRLTSGCGIALVLTLGLTAPVEGQPFSLIQETIVLSEGSVEVPRPAYHLVDVFGGECDAPGTCTNGVGPTGDPCLHVAQLTFTDGYLDTDGTIVTPNATFYNGQLGNLEITGHVGDIVQLTVRNQMPEAVNGQAIETGFYAPADNLQTIHWHGMELDNESDGSPVTEFGIQTGEQRLYQFRLYRPGAYWFYPHVVPLLTASRGQVGRLIVRSYEEDTLESLGVLPEQFRAIQLFDATVANAENQFFVRNGTVFPHFTAFEAANHLMPDQSPDLDGDGLCDRVSFPADCIVTEGELIFVNGQVPSSDQNIETIYVEEGGGARIAFINSSYERFYRFRLLLDGEEPPSGPAMRVNQTTTGQCYDANGVKFAGFDPLSCEQGLPLYRVGGQNGLLDRVRLEGQPEIPFSPVFQPRAYDTVIRTGEDFLGPGERTELVVVTKDRNGEYLQPGDSMFIWTIDYPHGRFDLRQVFPCNVLFPDAISRDAAARKLVKIEIVPRVSGVSQFDIAKDDPLMEHPKIKRPAEDLGPPLVGTSMLSVVPAGNDPFLNVPFEGTDDPNIMLTNQTADFARYPSINAHRGDYSGGSSMGTDVPTQASTRYARVGDVLELVYANNNGSAHDPVHLHGFSFQPVSIHEFIRVDNDNDGINETVTLVDPPIFEYPYNELVDVEVVQPFTALKYRVKLNDRYIIPDDTPFPLSQLQNMFPYNQKKPFGGSGDVKNPKGGAVGRWLFNSQVLHHLGLGMTGELCVAPAGAPDASGCKVDVAQDVNEPIGN